MNFYVNQSIHINYMRVESVSNSSILQIGSAGSIKSLSICTTQGVMLSRRRLSPRGSRL